MENALIAVVGAVVTIVGWLIARLRSVEKSLDHEVEKCHEDRVLLGTTSSDLSIACDRITTLEKLAVTAIVYATLEGKILQVTGGFETIFGWREHEVKGKPVEMLMSPTSLSKHHPAIERKRKQIEAGDESKAITRVNEGIARDKSGNSFAVSVEVGLCIFDNKQAFHAHMRRLS